MKRIYSLFYLSLFASAMSVHAADVTVTMNTVSKTMTLESVASGELIEVGAPVSNVYNFQAPAGDYILSGYATDGTTLNGTILVTVNDDDAAQEFKVLTCTAYATNSGWKAGEDYTIDVTVSSGSGDRQVITIGNSTTAGRKTFLALNGNSYTATFTPSQAHLDEGYTLLYKSATVTFNATASGAIPLGEDYTVTVPADAGFQMGIKFTHFVDFTIVEPKAVVEKGDTREITYFLAQSQVYNYRTWIDGGITRAGYFNMGTSPDRRPVLTFTPDDYKVYDSTTVNHDVASNKGYETGDIFVNINERGHLVMNIGDTFKAHAMRTWQLTDNAVNNYFMEPDFHYTVIDTDGRPSQGVVEIARRAGSAWADIKAVGKGTAIVLVTYDGIVADYYSGATRKEILGGEFWGAIWPENTAAYVITVGQEATGIEPGMYINESYNDNAKKVAGDRVDAEHDIFYYLDTDEGAEYTFTPQGVARVTIAYPSIGERMATYSGFSAEGVTPNEDGSYTLTLRHGRQIVQLTDPSGNSVYQILTARKCHREITNETDPDSDTFKPGDKVKIQYSGLHHPANKLAGIYNMSAYVTYNGNPNGTSLIGGAGQYTFGSVASAQAVSVTIPEDHDVDTDPEFVLDQGVIQVTGFGDPIGNHRLIDPVAGRSANFTAISHQTYFGSIPDVRIPVTPLTADDPAGIDRIETSAATPVSYYNLQGIQSST
ncbi:MAG: hypothetical protein K2I52_05030, partial [Muribaculaceae bacterium]|nr:hypothetical protein [Muribaculaceae bacterium]